MISLSGSPDSLVAAARNASACGTKVQYRLFESLITLRNAQLAICSVLRFLSPESAGNV